MAEPQDQSDTSVPDLALACRVMWTIQSVMDDQGRCAGRLAERASGLNKRTVAKGIALAADLGWLVVKNPGDAALGHVAIYSILEPVAPAEVPSASRSRYLRVIDPAGDHWSRSACGNSGWYLAFRQGFERLPFTVETFQEHSGLSRAASYALMKRLHRAALSAIDWHAKTICFAELDALDSQYVDRLSRLTDRHASESQAYRFNRSDHWKTWLQTKLWIDQGQQWLAILRSEGLLADDQSSAELPT